MKPKWTLLVLLGILLSVLAAFSNSKTEAWAALQKGFRLWDPEIMKTARDQFLALLLAEQAPGAELSHGLALCDFRLANFFLAAQNTAEADRYVAEARKYGEQARDHDPGLGESYALEAYLIGMEIALHPDRAMSLFTKSGEAFQEAFAKSPADPRVHLLKALSVFYTPEAFGGGAGTAQGYLESALDLFEKENASHRSQPAWGREEAFAYLGLCHKQLGNVSKAREFLKKALEISPDFAFASRELKTIPEK